LREERGRRGAPSGEEELCRILSTIHEKRYLISGVAHLIDRNKGKRKGKEGNVLPARLIVGQKALFSSKNQWTRGAVDFEKEKRLLHIAFES